MAKFGAHWLTSNQ